MVRRVGIRFLKIAGSIGLVWWLLSRIGLDRITGLIAAADAAWLSGAFLLFLASHLLGTLQWRMLLNAEDIRPAGRTLLDCYFTGLFFNNFLIGGAGGDVYRMLDMGRHSRKGTSAVSAVVLDRMVGFLVMSGLSVAAIPFACLRHPFGRAFWLPFAVMVLGWCFLCFFFFNKRFARPLTRLIRPFLPAKLQVKIREVYRKIHAFGRNRRLLLSVVAVSIAVQSARIVTHYCVGRSLGVTVPPVFYFLFIPIIAILATLPLTIGGIGLREQSGVVLLGLVGVTALQAVAVEFLAYLIAIGTSLPGGISFMLKRGSPRVHPIEAPRRPLRGIKP
jgi:glycosyltransferase 2 family protein